MPPLDGLTPELLRAAGWVLLFGVLIVSRDLPLRWAVPVALIKVAVPLAYFARDDFGALHLKDDLEYYYDALLLYQQGVHVGAFFVRETAFPSFLQSLGGFHAAYPLWNVAAFSAFGPYYFSPVFLNVGAAFAAGWFFFRILGHLGFARPYARGALVFFLLHWDVLARSSLLNMKDTLVLTLTLATLHAFILLFERPRAALFPWILLLLGILVFLRFYAPLIVLTAVLFRLVLEKGRGGRVAVVVVPLAAACAALFWTFGPTLPLAGWFRPWEIAWGIPRFLLTPLPWKLAESSEFLFLPAILHLLLFLPALAAVPLLWARGEAARFLLVYGGIVVLLYSMVPDLQGPRQRYQIAFLFAWAQFHGLWTLARWAAGRTLGHTEVGEQGYWGLGRLGNRDVGA